MIRVAPQAAGNAVSVIFDAELLDRPVRVLRRLDDAFAGPDDPGAVRVYDGELAVASLVDVADLENGVTYFYKVYVTDELGDWLDNDGEPVSATAVAWYLDGSVDARAIIRDRLQVGLVQEVARGLLKLKRRVAPDVLLGPPVYEDSLFPVFSVHLNNDADAEHGLDEDIGGIGEIRAKGYRARWSGQVVAWSQNPDERHALYIAMKRILIANLPIFEALELRNVSLSFTDQDFISGEYPATVYCSTCAIQADIPSYVIYGANPSDSMINSTAYNLRACED